MKKITFFLMTVMTALVSQAQTDYYTALPNNGGTSQNGRAPQGVVMYNRSVWLITSDEMATAGFDAGTVINALGFNYSAAQDVATTGAITIYLQNTADATNTKSTTWATAITGMTTASNGAVTIPAATGTFDIPFAGGTAFTYTGGGLYIAFDYQNVGSPLATVPNTALCTTTLTGGVKSAFSAATVPTTLTASNYRPETRLGKAVTCARPNNLDIANVTLTSADATFTADAGGTVSIEYGLFGFTQGFDGTVVDNVTSPYTIPGLDPSTVYDYYVKKDCGGGDESLWAGPFSFHTIFEPADTDYNTGFLQIDMPYIGWESNPVSANGWFINFGISQDGDDAAAAVVTPTAAAATERLYSRGLNLIAGSTVTVDYFVENFNSVTTATNTASYVLTAGTGKDAASQTIAVASETGLTNADFAEKTYTFTAPTTGVYYLCFQHTSPANATAGNTHAFLLDNVTVTQLLGVNQELSGKFSVYPNPVKNVVNISNTTNAVVSTVVITDLNGRTVKTQNINATTGSVSIADLASGMYMMSISTDQGKALKKIVKE